MGGQLRPTPRVRFFSADRGALSVQRTTFTKVWNQIYFTMEKDITLVLQVNRRLYARLQVELESLNHRIKHKQYNDILTEKVVAELKHDVEQDLLHTQATLKSFQYADDHRS